LTNLTFSLNTHEHKNRSNSYAVLEAVLGKVTSFERTPKFGTLQQGGWQNTGRYCECFRSCDALL
jgi:hypothetical protein